jgi:VanZ family protein
MLNNPPQEKEWRSWLWVALWSLVIFVTIPLARTIQEFVDTHWGRPLFGHLVITITILSGGTAAVHLFRQSRRIATRANYFWLVSVAAIYIWYTIQLRGNPEEAMHFVQYGVLGLLTYRALTHRIRDYSIYFSAAVIAGMIGIIDEAIQWLTPKRYWALPDIWLNFFGAALMQVAIARGLRPAIISAPVNPASVRTFCRLLVLGLVLLTASLLNTPSRIAWYAERIPFLAFLKNNDSVMLEYGHLYVDPEIGRFRSRLSPAELRRADAERGKEAAHFLDQFRDDDQYKEFLRQFTPANDPFLHEARVHLFRRDRYLNKALENTDNPETYRYQITVAYRENQIMEKYFPNTLTHSIYLLSVEHLTLLQQNFLPDHAYDSGVSKDLVTSVHEGQIAGGMVLAILGLLLVDWRLRRSQEL